MATQPNTSKPTGGSDPVNRNPRSNLIVNMNHKDLTELSKLLIWKSRKYLGISLAYNRIPFSASLCSQLAFIRYLNLSHNALTCLPQNFGDLSNLVVFEAANNQISKLPISISECRSLRFMDLRQNPFVTTWTALRTHNSLTFDPVEFAQYIVPFMKAVRKWRQNLIYARAEEMLEFLVVCPTFRPSVHDQYYDVAIRDYSNCPLANMHQTCPLKLELFLDSLENATTKTSPCLKFAYHLWRVVFGPFCAWIRKAILCCLMLIFLAAAFTETNWIGSTLARTPLGFVLHSCHEWLQKSVPSLAIGQIHDVDAEYF